MNYFDLCIIILFCSILGFAIWLVDKSDPVKIYPKPIHSSTPPTSVIGTEPPVSTPPTSVIGTEPPVSLSFPPSETLRAKLQPNTGGTTQTFWVEFGDGDVVAIDWGDGTTEPASKQAFHGENKIGEYEAVSHTYALSGTYDLQISGSCNSMVFSPPGLQTGSNDLVEIVQLGSVCTTVENMCLNNGTITKFTAGESSPYTNLNGVCKDCISLTQVDLAGVSSSVLSADSAWEGCIALTTFDTSTLSALTSAKRCWAGCTGLTTFSSAGLLNATTLDGTWVGCTGLTTFDNTEGFPALSGVVNSPFVGCANLTTFINVKGFANLNVNALALTFFLDLKNTVVSFNNTEGFGALQDCSNLFRDFAAMTTFNNARGLASGTTFVGTWLGSPITTFDNTEAFPLLNDNSVAVSYLSSLKNTVVNFNNTRGFAALEDCSNLFNTWPVLANFNNTRGLASGTTFAGTWTGSLLITTFDNTGAFPLLNDNAIALAYLGDLKNTVVNFNNTEGFAALEDCSNLFNTWTVLETFNNTRGLASGNMFAGTWAGSSLLTTFDNTGALPSLNDNAIALDYLSSLKTTVVNFNNTDGFALLLDCSNLFNAWPVLETFDNTRGLVSATSVNSTWALCPNLTSFETSSLGNVTSASSAWFGCSGLTTFFPEGLSGLVTAQSAWQSCNVLTAFDTSGMVNVLTCNSAWSGCSAMTTFSAAGLTAATNINFAWYNCSGLTEFPTTGLSSATSADFAWSLCTGLTDFFTTALVSLEVANSAWLDCTGLISFNASGLTNLSVMPSAWFGCIELEAFDTTFMINATDINGAWFGCTSLVTFIAAGLNSVTLANDAWRGCVALDLGLPGFSGYEGNNVILVANQINTFAGTLILTGPLGGGSTWERV